MTGKAVTSVFLALAIFCLYFIVAILEEQSRITGAPYELIARADDGLKNSTADAVKAIGGVIEAGDYMTAAAVLTVGDYSVNVTLYGFSKDYTINGKYKAGSGIILNETAIENLENEYAKKRQAFTDYYTPKYSLGSDVLLFSLDNIAENKTDGEAAAVYMSVNQMSLLLRKLGKSDEINQLIVKIENYSQLEDVKTSLGNLDLTVTSNTADITAEVDEYGVHILYLSIILALSLLSALATRKNGGSGILIVGYFIGTAAAFCLPYLFPPAERETLVFGLPVSLQSCFAVFAVIALIVAVRETFNALTRRNTVKS